MKIAQLNSQLSWRGGEQQVLYLSQFLQSHGYDNVTICPPESALYQRAYAAGLPIKALRMRHEFDTVAVWQLGGYLRDQHIDVLHMHTAHAHTTGLLAHMFAPHVRQVVSRRVDFSPRRHPWSRWKYSRPGVHYLAVSAAIRQVLMAHGVPAHHVQTIYSGVDLRRFDAVRETPTMWLQGKRVIGTVGHLVAHKGHSYLLAAVRLLLREEPDVEVVIVGDGALRRRLEAQAVALGIAKQVHFTGFRRDVLDLMWGFEIFVMPSSFEGLGTAMLDAMAWGKPVVATRTGGIPEVVQDGVTGLLVPPRDPEALCQALLYMLRHPAQGQQFGTAGRQRVETCFTAEQMALQTLQAYQRLLDHAR